MKTFLRLINSVRVWTAILGTATIVAVQCGMPAQKANVISASITGLVAVLIKCLSDAPA